jgi:hypothetical protein
MRRKFEEGVAASTLWQVKERLCAFCFLIKCIEAPTERQAQGGAYCRCRAVCRHGDL